MNRIKPVAATRPVEKRNLSTGHTVVSGVTSVTHTPPKPVIKRTAPRSGGCVNCGRSRGR